MKKSFDSKKYYFLDEESAPSGMLVIESVVDYEQIFAEKFYVLKMKNVENSGEYVFNDKIKSLACRGIPQTILNNQKEVIEDLDPSFGYQESAICRLGVNLGVANSVRHKILGGLMIPSRRFFFDSSNSIPFTFPVSDRRPLFNDRTLDYRHYLYDSPKKATKRKMTQKWGSNSRGGGSPQEDDVDNKRKNIKNKNQKQSGILTSLMSEIRSTADIIDQSYRNSLNCSSDNADLVYVAPKKRRRNVFIDYESKC